MSEELRGFAVNPTYLEDTKDSDIRHETIYNSTWNEPEIVKNFSDDIEFEKTIRCRAIRTNPIDDTSFGNRLYRWANAYYLSEATNFEYKILLQKELWPELLFLSLPHTFTKECKTFDFHENKLCPDIDGQKYYDIVVKKDKEFLKNNNHCTISNWFICSDNLGGVKLKELSENNPFSTIKFHFEEINEYFESKFKNFIGLHIRRYKGINVTESDFETIPENVRDDYKKEHTKCFRMDKGSYPFIPDEEYYELIDNILEHDQNQCFYISTDLPLKFYAHYKTKYKNIFCRHDYEKEFMRLLQKYHPDIVLTKIESIVNCLFDFFAFGSTKVMVLAAQSSWGRVCTMRRPQAHKIVLPIENFCPHFKKDKIIYSQYLNLSLYPHNYKDLDSLSLGGSYYMLLLDMRKMQKNNNMIEQNNNILVIHEDILDQDEETIHRYNINGYKFKLWRNELSDEYIETIMKNLLSNFPD